MISAEPFLRYVSCSSTDAKVDMGKDIIRNAEAEVRMRKLELSPREVDEAHEATNIHIRKATPADVPRLREVIEASVRGLQAEDYSPAQIEGALKSVYGVDSQLIVDGTYLVVEFIESARPALKSPPVADGASARLCTAAINTRAAKIRCSTRRAMRQRFAPSSYIQSGRGAVLVA